MRRIPENDGKRLGHMLDAALEARQLLQGQSIEAFMRDRSTQLAIDKLVQIVGEAANNVTPGYRAANDQIPWTDMIGMRHRLVHVYYETDLNILWGTVADNLPPLIAELEKMLEGAEEK